MHFTAAYQRVVFLLEFVPSLNDYCLCFLFCLSVESKR